MQTVRKAVVLLSGGLDSATCLALARRQGYDCYALSFDYGQRHIAELAAAKRIVESLGARDHKVIKLDLGGLGAALAALVVSRHVDFREIFKADAAPHVDGLGDGAVDEGLRRRLHRQVIGGADGLGVDEIFGQGSGFAELSAESARGIILDLLLRAPAIGLQHLAGVIEGEDRLDAARDIVGEE